MRAVGVMLLLVACTGEVTPPEVPADTGSAPTVEDTAPDTGDSQDDAPPVAYSRLDTGTPSGPIDGCETVCFERTRDPDPRPVDGILFAPSWGEARVVSVPSDLTEACNRDATREGRCPTATTCAGRVDAPGRSVSHRYGWFADTAEPGEWQAGPSFAPVCTATGALSLRLDLDAEPTGTVPVSLRWSVDGWWGAPVALTGSGPPSGRGRPGLVRLVHRGSGHAVDVWVPRDRDPMTVDLRRGVYDVRWDRGVIGSRYVGPGMMGTLTVAGPGEATIEVPGHRVLVPLEPVDDAEPFPDTGLWSSTEAWWLMRDDGLSWTLFGEGLDGTAVLPAGRWRRVRVRPATDDGLAAVWTGPWVDVSVPGASLDAAPEADQRRRGVVKAPTGLMLQPVGCRPPDVPRPSAFLTASSLLPEPATEAPFECTVAGRGPFLLDVVVVGADRPIHGPPIGAVSVPLPDTSEPVTVQADAVQVLRALTGSDPGIDWFVNDRQMVDEVGSSQPWSVQVEARGEGVVSAGVELELDPTDTGPIEVPSVSRTIRFMEHGQVSERVLAVQAGWIDPETDRRGTRWWGPVGVVRRTPYPVGVVGEATVVGQADRTWWLVWRDASSEDPAFGIGSRRISPDGVGPVEIDLTPQTVDLTLLRGGAAPAVGTGEPIAYSMFEGGWPRLATPDPASDFRQTGRWSLQVLPEAPIDVAWRCGASDDCPHGSRVLIGGLRVMPPP